MIKETYTLEEVVTWISIVTPTMYPTKQVVNTVMLMLSSIDKIEESKKSFNNIKDIVTPVVRELLPTFNSQESNPNQLTLEL